MRNLWIFILLFSSFPLAAQVKYTDAIPFGSRINFVTQGGTQIISGLAEQKRSLSRISRDTWYSWYKKDSVFFTRGGFSGRLLHGDYQEFFSSNMLKTVGKHKLGKKVGLWRYWDVDGILRKEERWKEGRKTGTFRIYNNKGALIQKGKMKNGLINGIVKEFSTDDASGTIIRRYKNGQKVNKNSKLGIFIEQAYIKINSL